MAFTFARKPIVNMQSGVYEATVASVGTPRTSASGNMTTGVMFKNSAGECAFQYCNLNEDAVLVIDAADDSDDQQIVLPDNTQIFIDRMTRAGVANPLLNEELAEKLATAKSMDDPDLRKSAVVDLLYKALRGYIGATVQVTVEQAQFKQGSRSTINEIEPVGGTADADDDIDIDAI